MADISKPEDGELEGGGGSAGKLSAANLKGHHKGLIFLISIDEETATQALSHMEPEEVLALRQASEAIEEVDPEVLADIHREFILKIKGELPANLRGSSSYLRRLAGKALGEGKATNLWDKGIPKESGGPVAELEKLDNHMLHSLLEKEHPQTLAVLLSLFDPARAAEVLMGFPAPMQAEVVTRMARLKSIPEATLQEIEGQIAKELQNLSSTKNKAIEGVEAASKVLRLVSGDAGTELMASLSEVDEDLADKLRKSLFTFDDLMRVDGRGLQVLLKDIPSDRLVLTLKTASPELKQRIFENMSSRAASMLRYEYDMLGPVRLAEVEEARNMVVEVALRLEEEGRIQITREGGGDFI